MARSRTPTQAPIAETMSAPARSYGVGRLAVPELLLLLVLAGWSLLVLGHLLARVPAGGELTGADGPFAADQLQYLSWVRDSGTHVLAGDLFQLPAGARVLLHPMWLVSGLIWRAGMPIAVAGLIWKPLAAAAIVLAVRAYVAPLVTAGAWARTAVVGLALFYFSPFATVYDRAAALAGEMFTAGAMWGYLPTVLAVALTAVYLLALERATESETSRDRLAACGIATGAGLFASWLHPWQGEVAAVITIGLLMWTRDRRGVLPLLVGLAATTLPLMGYFALAHLDASWRLAQSATTLPRAPLGALVAALAPLGLAAVTGLRGPGSSTQERALLLWPFACLLTYFLLSPSFPDHALGGIAIPLAVLAARGAQRIHALARSQPARIAAALAVCALAAALIVPGAIHVARATLRLVGAGRSGHVIVAPERAALRFLASAPGVGGVLAPFRLAILVPAFTGRPTWLGHPSWTPDFTRRAQLVDALVAGTLADPQARALVAGSGARYVLLGCNAAPSSERALMPLASRVRRFGCVTVLTLSGSGTQSAGQG